MLGSSCDGLVRRGQEALNGVCQGRPAGRVSVVQISNTEGKRPWPIATLRWDGHATANASAAASAARPFRPAVWGVAGDGGGSLTLKPRDGAALAMEIDMDHMMATVGLRAWSWKRRRAVVDRARSDAMVVRTSSDAVQGLEAAAADVTRLQLGLEGSCRAITGSGGELVPRLEMGSTMTAAMRRSGSVSISPAALHGRIGRAASPRRDRRGWMRARPRSVPDDSRDADATLPEPVDSVRRPEARQV